MNFDYDLEQQQLANALRRFLANEYDFAARTRILASGNGHSPPVWTGLAEIGLLALPLPEEYDGFGGGMVDMMNVMEALGEALVVEPYLATLGLGAQFVLRAGSDEQKRAILPAVAAGELKLAFAHLERDARYDLAYCATSARRSGAGWQLDGAKSVVLHGACADLLVVTARVEGETDAEHGLCLFLVPANTPGVTLREFHTADDLPGADIRFDRVVLAPDALLGHAGQALPLVEEVVDYATALLCAEAVGVLRLAYQSTLEFLKTRKQFGVAIGSFQAVQHRMVDLFIDLEQAQSMACLVCARMDAGLDTAERRRLVSAAKIRIADACRRSSQETVQLQGAMGMSDEMMISHAHRRLTMIAQQFGDAEHHLERFAD